MYKKKKNELLNEVEFFFKDTTDQSFNYFLAHEGRL